MKTAHYQKKKDKERQGFMETLRQRRKNGLRKKGKKPWKHVHQGIKTRENGHT